MSTLFDDIRDGLNSLLERVGGAEGDGPARDVSRSQIEQELVARAAKRGPMPDITSPIARRASSSPDARRAREKMAAEREARVRGVRAAREQDRSAAEARAREEAFRDAKRRAQQQQQSYQSPPSSGPSAGGPHRSRRTRAKEAVFGRDDAIAKHYKTLNLPYGAPFDEVKKAFRQMMRKYHPDMHSGNPQKQKAASELTKQLTVAYNELDNHLNKDA